MLNLKPIPGAPTKAPKANKPEPRGRQKWNTAAHVERDDSKPQAPNRKPKRTSTTKRILCGKCVCSWALGKVPRRRTKFTVTATLPTLLSGRSKSQGTCGLRLKMLHVPPPKST